MTPALSGPPGFRAFARVASRIGKGASLRWWVGDPAAQESIVYDPALRAALLHSLLLAS